MKITCQNCGNTTDFTLLREVEVPFDAVAGKWYELKFTIGREIIYCRECDNDQDSVEILVEEE